MRELQRADLRRATRSSNSPRRSSRPRSFWRFGWHWQSVAALFFTWALVALTVIDLDHQILPDIITLPLLWLGLLPSLAWHAGLTPPAPTDPRSAILGAAAGYLSLWSVYWAFKLLTGKEGMGYGDFKLFGALGAWMGWQMLPLILLLSAFTGAVVGIALIVAARPRPQHPDPVRPLPRRRRLDRADVGPADRRRLPRRLPGSVAEPARRPRAMTSPTQRPFRVALTGGIASGKTTVADLFAALGVPVIDTDVIAREVVEPGQPALAAVVEAFGPDVLDADGRLDRRRLRERIFADPDGPAPPRGHPAPGHPRRDGAPVARGRRARTRCWSSRCSPRAGAATTWTACCWWTCPRRCRSSA